MHASRCLFCGTSAAERIAFLPERRLRLENVGNAPLSTLRLAISTPLVMPALSLEGKGRSDAVSAAMVEPGAAFPLPQGSNGLKPGETLEWPVRTSHCQLIAVPCECCCRLLHCARCAVVA